MANGGDHGDWIAAATALVVAAGAALAALLQQLPKVRDAAKARAEAKRERIREERALVRERAAFAAAFGDLAEWGPEHPVCRLLDTSRSAWCIVDEGAFVWGNPAFCALLGFEPSEVAGAPWLDRIAPESLPAVRAARERLMGGREVVDLRLRMVRLGSGETIAVRAYSTPGPQPQLVRLDLDHGAP